jgi:D-tyrosyl-tRNA(Tyr) deacylase
MAEVMRRGRISCKKYRYSIIIRTISNETKLFRLVPGKSEEVGVKAVLQRVNYAAVHLDGETVSKIGKGLLILLGVGAEDTQADAGQLAARIAHLRIFEDEEGKMNLSCLDVEGEALVVSQFTLFADTSRGRRPSFVKAGDPKIAKPLWEYFIGNLQGLGVPTKAGVFGSFSQIELENNGPVTILMEQPIYNKEKK